MEEINVIKDSEKRFTFEGHEGSLDEFLAANAEDVEVCRWLRRCEIDQELYGCKRIK